MSAKVRPMTRCPNCGARGVMINAPLEKDGFVIRDRYCGICGKNWPEPIEPRETEAVSPFPKKGES